MNGEFEKIRRKNNNPYRKNRKELEKRRTIEINNSRNNKTIIRKFLGDIEDGNFG